LKGTFIKNLSLVVASLLLAVSLSACGSGSGASGSLLTPTVPVVPITAQHASVSLSFIVPQNDSQASPILSKSSNRTTKFVSPGQNNFTLIVDGIKVLNAAVISPALANTTSSPDGNTKVTVTYAGAGNYYTYTVGIDTLAGTHRVGVEILGNKPQIILSEAQNVYTLQPGANPPATLTLKGVISTGYIECGNGPVNSTNCSSSFVADTTFGTGGVYTLTAIGADYDGFPIASQPGISFDNGGFTVVETDTNAVLRLTQNSPFTVPGTQLTGPSGGYYVAQTARYGQPFQARCLKTGSTVLALQNVATGPNDPLVGETYVTYDPSTGGTTGNYPGAGILRQGDKTPGNPNYHNGSNPNAVTNLLSVSCTPNLQLLIN